MLSLPYPCIIPSYQLYPYINCYLHLCSLAIISICSLLLYTFLHASHRRHLPQTELHFNRRLALSHKNSVPSRPTLLRAHSTGTQNYWSHRSTAYSIVNAHCLNTRRHFSGLARKGYCFEPHRLTCLACTTTCYRRSFAATGLLPVIRV